MNALRNILTMYQVVQMSVINMSLFYISIVHSGFDTKYNRPLTSELFDKQGNLTTVTNCCSRGVKLCRYIAKFDDKLVLRSYTEPHTVRQSRREQTKCSVLCLSARHIFPVFHLKIQQTTRIPI